VAKTKTVMIQPIPIVVEVALMVNCGAKTKTMMPTITKAAVVEIRVPAIAEMLSIIVAKIKSVMI
jgi:hypothetical protein